MNQEKIGKLIAKLRKEKGLTQRELGEMVGVGYRAVSKWETGLTMPDISIINELSTILGISSDELLKGEQCSKENLAEEPIVTKNETSKKKLVLLLISVLLITVISLLIINNREKPQEYIIKSQEPNDYTVEGLLIIEKKNIIIRINKIQFQNYDFYQTPIVNYNYSVTLDNTFMFGYGGTDEYNNIDGFSTINSFFKKFKINYIDNEQKSIKKLNKKELNINFYFIDDKNNTIKKEVKTMLTYKTNSKHQ